MFASGQHVSNNTYFGVYKAATSVPISVSIYMCVIHAYMCVCVSVSVFTYVYVQLYIRLCIETGILLGLGAAASS